MAAITLVIHSHLKVGSGVVVELIDNESDYK